MTTNGCSITPNDKEVLKEIFSQGLLEDDFSDGVGDNIPNEVTENENDAQAKALEILAVREADRGNSDKALEFCNQAIALTPYRPSIYNNRAQIFRLLGNIDGALSDLNKAITLSHEKGTAACQAFTQRGLIKIRNDDKESAKADLQKAADLGSNYAKQVLAAMNPYAALCNQMLGEVMQKLQTV